MPFQESFHLAYRLNESLPLLSMKREQLNRSATMSLFPSRGSQMAENRLICVASTNKSHFLPDETMLMVTLRQAGLPVNMCKIGGAYLQECIPVGGHGARTLTHMWRLVTVNAPSKEEMMENFNIIDARLACFNVKVSNWTWTSR
jgi:hypothetical protein